MQSRRVPWVVGFAFAGLLLAACEGDVSINTGTGAPCGPLACEVNQYCCDAACGLCVAEAESCNDTCAE
ncbi:MAG: hypothetical protein FJ096_14210 [Deltaproteobacteria bacterium]|nr:hypothetical protein [Deltaproteobacteria bacterium]